MTVVHLFMVLHTTQYALAETHCAPINVGANQQMQLCVSKSNIHPFIFMKYTQSISESKAVSWGIVLFQQACHFLLSLPIISVSLPANNQIKVKLEKSAACYHWCLCIDLQKAVDLTGRDHISDQNVNVIASAWAKGLVKQLCLRRDMPLSYCLSCLAV